jgi:hypothetical protein
VKFHQPGSSSLSTLELNENVNAKKVKVLNDFDIFVLMFALRSNVDKLLGPD